jgi:hypothetical protein
VPSEPNGSFPRDELDHAIIVQLGRELGAMVRGLTSSAPGISTVIGVHRIVERLLADIVSARLPMPERLLKEADFRTLTNVAASMGLLNDVEFNACRVLNSARNHAAHEGNVPAEVHQELVRLGKQFADSDEASVRLKTDTLEGAAKAIIGVIGMSWLAARGPKEKILLYEVHQELLQKVIGERVANLEDSEVPLAHTSPLRDRLVAEIGRTFAAEVAKLITSGESSPIS